MKSLEDVRNNYLINRAQISANKWGNTYQASQEYLDQWEAYRQQYADWHQKHSCTKHEPVSFGGKKVFCKKCDADMEMDEDFVWRVK